MSAFQSSPPSTHAFASFESPLHSSSSREIHPSISGFTNDPWLATGDSPAALRSSVLTENGGHLNESVSHNYDAEPGFGDIDAGRDDWDLQTENSQDLEKVEVRLAGGLAGNWMKKFQVYQVESEKRQSSVARRYSDWHWLLECLHSRYPFRLLPSLPSKAANIAGHHLVTDDLFLERRRRGLERALNSICAHPILRHDPLVTTFLTESSDLAGWRKGPGATIQLEEEFYTRPPLTSVEEMSIPSDLEEKVASFKIRLPIALEQWTRIVQLLERTSLRLQAQSVDYLRIKTCMDTIRTIPTSQPQPAPTVDWRPAELESTDALLATAGNHLATHAAVLSGRYERFGASQAVGGDGCLTRFIAFRELWHSASLMIARCDKLGLASDRAVETMRARQAKNQAKLSTLQAGGAPADPTKQADWVKETNKLGEAIEADGFKIEEGVRRRVFINHTLWHEIRLLYRQTTSLEALLQTWAADERLLAERVERNFDTLKNALGKTSGQEQGF